MIDFDNDLDRDYKAKETIILCEVKQTFTSRLEINSNTICNNVLLIIGPKGLHDFKTCLQS